MRIPSRCSLLFAVACSADRTYASATFDTASNIEEFGPGVSDTGLEADESSTASWWRLSANLKIEEGEIQLADTLFDVEVLEDDRHAICSVLAVPIAAERHEVPPHKTISAWWDLTVESWDGSCNEVLGVVSLPLEFQLGIGEMHPEILAVLDNLTQAQSGSDVLLSSAFASFDASESLLVFGAAGTMADFAGEAIEGTPDESLAGDYFIHPLYPFAYLAD